MDSPNFKNHIRERDLLMEEWEWEKEMRDRTESRRNSRKDKKPVNLTAVIEDYIEYYL